MLPDDLPEDMPSFVARFGSDEQCREYLFEARWPDGSRCVACGHDDAYALRTKIVCECAACGKQHSLLAGTAFEQTKTGLSRWFLAIHLATSSKRGISAMELKRQMGFASYGTAWTWLHKIRKAMVRPDRKPWAHHVGADEWTASRGVEVWDQNITRPHAWRPLPCRPVPRPGCGNPRPSANAAGCRRSRRTRTPPPSPPHGCGSGGGGRAPS
jgi:hypothetical protein